MKEPIEVREKIHAFSRPPTSWPAILSCKKVEHETMPGTMEITWLCARETRRLDEPSVMLQGTAGKESSKRIPDEVWKRRADPSGYAAHIWKHMVKTDNKTVLADVPAANNMHDTSKPSRRAMHSTWEELKGHVKALGSQKNIFSKP